MYFAYILKEKTVGAFFPKLCYKGMNPSFSKDFLGRHKARPGQLRDHILCNCNSTKYRRQSNHMKDASSVLGCSTEQADDKAAKRVLHRNPELPDLAEGLLHSLMSGLPEQAHSSWILKPTTSPCPRPALKVHKSPGLGEFPF